MWNYEERFLPALMELRFCVEELSTGNGDLIIPAEGSCTSAGLALRKLVRFVKYLSLETLSLCAKRSIGI